MQQASCAIFYCVSDDISADSLVTFLPLIRAHANDLIKKGFLSILPKQEINCIYYMIITHSHQIDSNMRFYNLYIKNLGGEVMQPSEFGM